MSILVRGMEMPESCCNCAFHVYHSYGEYVCATTPLFYPMNLANYTDGRKDFCPLVEVPTPHGRLIDADALLSDDEIMQILTSNPQRAGKLIKEFTEMFVDKANRQPTIIEAEGSENENHNV